MNKIFLRYKYLILSALLVSSFGIGQKVVAQHEGRIGAHTFGGARDLWTTEKLSMAIGSDLTF